MLPGCIRVSWGFTRVLSGVGGSGVSCFQGSHGLFTVQGAYLSGSFRHSFGDLGFKILP